MKLRANDSYTTNTSGCNKCNVTQTVAQEREQKLKELQQKPMLSYYKLEDWLYKQKDKPIEIKSAMVWGALNVLTNMGEIDWNTMRQMYGEFMSKQMGLR